MVIPSTATSLGSSIFSNCTNLKEVSFESNTNYLHSAIFFGCTGLERVKIGASVNIIGYNAFKNCTALKTLVCKATTPPSIEKSDEFDHISETATLQVPAASVDAYKKAPGWSKWKNIEPIIPTGIADPETANNSQGDIFMLDGRKVQHPTKGVYIQHGRKVLFR